MSLSSNYQLELGDSYKGVPLEEDFYSKLWITKEFAPPVRTKYSKRDTYREVLNWSPLEFLNLNGALSPLQTLSTRFSFTKIQNYEETTGTPLTEDTLEWPNMRLSMRSIEKFPLFKLGRLDDVNTDFEYSKKDVEKHSISHQLANNWLNIWRYRFFDKFNFTVTYKEANLQEENLKTGTITKESESISRSGQVNFNLFNNWTFFLRYEWNTSEEMTGAPLRPTKQTVSHTPSLRVYSQRIELKEFRPPLFRQGITTRLKVDSTIKADIKRNKLDAKANSDTYSLSLSAEGDASENIRFRLGVDCSRRHYPDKSQSVNDYWAIAGYLRVTITF